MEEQVSTGPYLTAEFYQTYQKGGGGITPIEDAIQHIELLYKRMPPDDCRLAVVGKMLRPKKGKQSTKEKAKIVQELRNFEIDSDLYVSVAPYNGIRKTGVWPRAAIILFSDLDDLNSMEWARNLSDSARAGYVIRELKKRNLPIPTFVVATGRGLHLIWRLTAPLSQKFFHLWASVQGQLYQLLRDLGADSNCLDITRTLRLAGSINSKPEAAGARCRILGYCEKEVDFFALIRDFQLRPLIYEDLTWLDHLRDDEFARLPSEVDDNTNEDDIYEVLPNKNNVSRFTTDNLKNWLTSVLSDLTVLTIHRCGKCKGYRDLMLLITLNTEAQLGITTSKNLMTRARILADKIDPKWSDRNWEEMGTLRDRLANGQGPYHYKAQTICERLNITEEEATNLKLEILIPSGSSKQVSNRHRNERRIKIMQLAAKGESHRSIAKKLGVSEATVSRDLRSSGYSSSRVEISLKREQVIKEIMRYAQNGSTATEIAEAFGFSRATAYRYLRESCLNLSKEPNIRGGTIGVNREVDMSSCPDTGNPAVNSGDNSSVVTAKVTVVSAKSKSRKQRSSSKRHYKFTEQELEELRMISIWKIKDLFDLEMEVDSAFKAIKDRNTKCINVQFPDGSYHEIIVTAPKWFDKTSTVGGGGAIDFVMNLFNCSFKDAAQKLRMALQKERDQEEYIASMRKLLQSSGNL